MKKTILLCTISVLILSLGLSTCTTQYSISLDQAATLYSGPGNINYKILAELPVGTELVANGIFGDFIQVSVNGQGKSLTGFIHRTIIQDETDNLDTLDPLQFDWEPMFLPECSPGDYDAITNTVTFDHTQSDAFFSLESPAWNLEQPVRIVISRLAITGGSSINIYGNPEGTPPSQWWQGLIAMGIDVNEDGFYRLSFLDGTSERRFSVNLEREATLPMQILFDQPEGKGISILDENNKEIKHIDITTLSGVTLPSGLFPERKLYFGVSVNSRSALSVRGLKIGTVPDGRWSDMTADSSGLAELGLSRHVNIGTMFDIQRMIDRRYCQVIVREFNEIVVPEFNWFWPPFWLGRGQYDFTSIDRIVHLAERYSWRVDASHLVWGDYSAIPDWLLTGSFTRDEYIAILQEHIRNVVGHYRGRVQEWSIANEAVDRISATLADANTSSRDFWYDRIGREYIGIAFKTAREADPDAILVFNSAIKPPFDRNNQAALDLMRSIVKELNSKDRLIDAVGWQMHLLTATDTQTPPDKQDTINLIREFAKLGAHSYFTEMEVDVGTRLTSQAESYTYQAWVYREMVDACLESGACDGIFFWGFSDAISWIICSRPFPYCMDEPNGDPLLYGRDFKPKPAYKAVHSALAGQPSDLVQPNYIPFEITTVPTDPPPGAGVAQDLYDGFGDVGTSGGYDRSKWRVTGSSRGPKVHYENGSLVLLDASDVMSGDITLVARKYDGVILNEPLFMEAGVTLPAGSAPGSISLKITATASSQGTWIAGCGIERYSSQFRSSCGDFIWSTQSENKYKPADISFDPGSRHIFRIELDPQHLRIRYLIDGIEVGDNVFEGGALSGSVRFTFSLATWKSTVNQPLQGVVDYVSIGPLDE
jgi:endo-1,4-beta-xylanase